MLEEKNIQSKKYQLGQFFTPVDLVSQLLGGITITADVIVEPSFGGCGFIEPLVAKYPTKKIVGVELDKEWHDKGKQRFPNLQLTHANFYDIGPELVFDNTKKVSFVGNVPFRSPAYSLTTHKKYVKQLAHKYGVTGIREEAVFFIIKTADIIIQNKYQSEVHYIIPKSLITNDSKFYKQFKLFLKKYFKIESVLDVDPAKFENVAQGLIMLSMTSGGDLSNYTTRHNGNTELVDDVIQLTSPDIPFQEIFKRTYLGSVPAESFLLSSSGETKDEFCKRISHIFNTPTSVASLKTDLAFNGTYHLKVLNSKDASKVEAKLEQINTYISTIKNKVSDLSIFADLTNYVEIQHRKEVRYYFRNVSIKNCGFVYELNPNPQASFYFTSNPSAGSTDYFGYCNYDINRNSSPGCCRTIPVTNAENNLTDSFKAYWIKETKGLPFELVFSYVKYVANSPWYKKQKKIRRRFYFCIPKLFMTSWLDSLDQKYESTLVQKFIYQQSLLAPQLTLTKNKKIANIDPAAAPLFEQL